MYRRHTSPHISEDSSAVRHTLERSPVAMVLVDCMPHGEPVGETARTYNAATRDNDSWRSCQRHTRRCASCTMMPIRSPLIGVLTTVWLDQVLRVAKAIETLISFGGGFRLG